MPAAQALPTHMNKNQGSFDDLEQQCHESMMVRGVGWNAEKSAGNIAVTTGSESREKFNEVKETRKSQACLR